MKKVLLSIATLGLLMSANAQNLNYGFEETDVLPSRMDKFATDAPEEGVKVDGVIYQENWSNYPNCSKNTEYTDDKYSGSRSLFVATDEDITEGWNRVIAFDNIGLKENASYRVSFMLKGKGDMRVALLKGCFNHDMALQSGTGTSYTEQVTSVQFDNSSWGYQSAMFWAPTRETMAAARKASWIGNSNDIDNDSIWQLDFLRLSFMGAGTYNIDDILVEESSIAGIAFNGKAIEVDFGYKTNLSSFTEKSSVFLSGEKFVVKVNGVEQEGISVQALKEQVEEDAYITRLVIFTEEDIPNDATVTVSYTNEAKALKYASSLAPFSFEEENAAVLDFTDEPAHYDRDLEATSLEDMGAVLEATTPAHREMHVDAATTQFTFRFSQAVVAEDSWMGAPVATLDGEELVFVGLAEGNDSILVFKRESAEPLAKGQHTLEVANVYNSWGGACEDADREANFFEVGDVTEEDLNNTELNKVFFCFNDTTVPQSGSVLPTAAQGWRHMDNGNWVAWGVGRNGTGGVMDVRTPFKRGLYIRLPNSMTNYGWWYGCFDEEGAPAFELPEGRMNFSYEVIGWDGALPNTEFHIYKYEAGKTAQDYMAGDSWFVKKIKTSDNVNGNKDGNPDSYKTVLDIEEAGRYVIRLAADGQAVFGNIKFERVGSITVLNTKNLLAAVANAEAERATADADQYVGATRDALDNTIKSAKETVFHFESEFDAAIADLNAAVSAMKARRADVDAYPASLEALRTSIAETAEKFQGIDAYKNAVEKEAYYAEVDYVGLNDEDLKAAVAGIEAASQYLSNLTTISIPLLTKQMTQLAAAIVKLDETLETNEDIVAVSNVITDNQTLIEQLKVLYTATLYSQIANGKTSFSHQEVNYTYSEEGDVTDSTIVNVTDSIDLSFMIQNNEFYCTAQVPAGQETAEAKPEDFPGWDITVLRGGPLRPVWSTNWGQAAPSETKPVENCAVRTSWGNSEYDVKQVINTLPAGKYTASIVIGEDGGDPHGAYAYVHYGVLNDTACYEDTSVYVSSSYSRDNTVPQVFMGIAPAVENNTAYFTLAGHINVAGGFGNVDNAKIFMTGTDENFDYAKAAEELKAYYTGITPVQSRTDAPVSVMYYNLAGQQIAAPQGISLKVESYSDGYTVVKKIMVK